MIAFLRKLRDRSFAELQERTCQKLAALLELHGPTAMTREPSDAALAHRLLRGSAASDSAEARLVHFRTRVSPRFFGGVRDGKTAVALCGARWSDARAALVASAELVLAGSFDLLGHQGPTFGTPIDWHLDPTSGRRAPRTHWSRIPYLDAALVGDHKVVWEINRHQHFVVLGRAYQVTGDARYARCFVDQITSWMNDNPPKYGVNWSSSLEIAYRAISWLWALELFREASQLDAPLLSRMLKSLHIHGRHLERYLSTYFSPNTHLTGEALGLLYLGTMLPELRRADRWRTAGWRILERELFKQVHPDGVYFEQATYYHRYTVDIYLHALLLTRANGQATPTDMVARLALAAEHLADLTRPDGTIPVIGDDDGGCLVALEDRAPTDVRATLGVAAVALEDPTLARVAGGATEEVLWVLGPEAATRVDDTAAGPPPAHTSRLFPTGGYVVMRDGWARDAHHAVIDCGPHGVMNCGHAHSDALSIEIAALGQPVIVDPGTFTYTSSAADRDYFRHSASHNTVTLDGESASVPAGPFSWQSRADAKIEHWWSGELVDYFVGSHLGFARLPDPAVHRRQILFVRAGYWAILDTIEARGEHEAVAHLHLAAGARVTATSLNRATVEVGGRDDVTRVLLYVGGDAHAFEWSDGWVSPAYGSRVRAPHARARSRGVGRRDIVTVVLPVAGLDPHATRGFPCKGGVGVSVERGDMYDTLLFRRAGIVRAESLDMDADAALVRRSASSGKVLHVALFGRTARLVIGAVNFQATGEAEFWWTDDGWGVRGSGRVESADAQPG